MTIDDLEAETLDEQTHDLLNMQAAAQWKARHAELQGVREGLYADLYAEREKADATATNTNTANLRGGVQGAFARKALKGIFGKAGSALGRRR